MWDATVFCKAQARKNKQDKCESLNRVKKVLPSLAPFQLGIFSNVAGSPHGDVVFDWVVNCVTAIAQGLVDGKIPASQQIYNAICERTIISSACAERLVALIGVRAQQAESPEKALLGYLHSSNLRWRCENITTKATMTAFYPVQLPLPCDSVELTNRAPPTEQKRLAQSLHLFIRNSEVPRYRTIRILDFWPFIRSLYST